MIISRINKGDTVHYCLHAEQAVTGVILNDGEIGIYAGVLTIETLSRVKDDLGERNNCTVILDFKHIKNCQNNLNTIVSDLILNCKLLVFTNVNKASIVKLKAGIFANPNNKLSEDGETFTEFYASNTGSIDIESSEVLFLDEFKKHLVKFTDDAKNTLNGDPHHSSSVYLTKYINVKGMISHSGGIMIYSLYKLALKIKSHWHFDDVEGGPKPILICQNLNGSYIASILSSMLHLDVLILDKLGPINKLYSTLDKKIESGKQYIVVSDVVCLGTEVKIAKSLITFLGGQYLGNVSLVRVEAIDPEVRPFHDIEYVFSISREDNPIDFHV